MRCFTQPCNMKGKDTHRFLRFTTLNMQFLPEKSSRSLESHATLVTFAHTALHIGSGFTLFDSLSPTPIVTTTYSLKQPHSPSLRPSPQDRGLPRARNKPCPGSEPADWSIHLLADQADYIRRRGCYPPTDVPHQAENPFPTDTI